VHPGGRKVSRRQHVEKHDVQVNEAEEPVVEERTTVTTRREI
jgi:hypothetical protein